MAECTDPSGMSASPKELMQGLLAKGLLTPEEVQEATRLLEEAGKAGKPLPLTEALLRAGVLQARKAHAAAARLEESAAASPSGDEGVSPLVTGTGLRLIERIGRGSQAIVYKCQQVDMDRLVAVKVLLSTHARDEKLRSRFVQEARSAAQLQHPNIVTIHDIRPYRDTFYIVMEYVDGGTVAELLKVRKRFDLAEAVTIIRGAARGLAHAHSRGFIHRDIKPSNIMLTAEGIPKLADLGLARHESEAGEEDGKAYGTPYYISPEQVTGDPPPDFRTDLYSLGVTFYQMVTGRPPFMAATPQEIMRMHVIARWPDPREFVPDLPQALCWLLAKACAREPEDRYQNAEDFITALDQLDLSRTESSATADLPEAVDDDDAATARGRQFERATVLEEARLGRARPKSGLSRNQVLLVGGIGGALVIGALAVGAYYVATAAAPPPVKPPVKTPVMVVPPLVPAKEPTPTGGKAVAEKPKERPKTPAEVAAEMESNALEALQAAKRFEAKPNASLLDVAGAYQNVVNVYPDSKAAEEARQAVKRIMSAASCDRYPAAAAGAARTDLPRRRHGHGQGRPGLPPWRPAQV